MLKPDDDKWVTRFVPLAESRVATEDSGRLIGYPIVFNTLSQDLGGWKERIAPSAVDRTLKAGTNVDALLDHRRDTLSIIGSTDSGLMRQEKRTKGLYVRIDPPDTTFARDAVTNVRAGLVKGMSFAFRPYVYADGTRGVVWTEEDDWPIRTVTDMEYSEVSVVINPAYLQTIISVRTHAIDQAALEEFRALHGWKPSRAFRERALRAESR